MGFNWGEYLEETGASAAPHTSFKHVRDPPDPSLFCLRREDGESAGRCQVQGDKGPEKGRGIQPGCLRSREAGVGGGGRAGATHR